MTVFRILGPFEVDRIAVRSTRGQQGRLLGALLLEHNRSVRATELADLVYGTERSGRDAQLLVLVARLRRDLRDTGSPATVVTVAGGYRLDADPSTLDAVEFESLLTNPQQARDAATVRRDIDRALTLWRGEVLDGLGLEHHPRALRLSEQRDRAWEERFTIDLLRGDSEGSLPLIVEQCRSRPTHERLAGLAMLGLYLADRQPDALRLFQSTRAALIEQHGLEPHRELRQIEAAVLDNDIDPILAALRTRFPLLSEQSDARYMPPIPHQRDMPAPIGHLFGRVADVTAIAAAVPRDRLLTIVGPGGIGKTRTAIEVAASLPTLDTSFVDLAVISSNDEVIHTVARVLDAEVFTDGVQTRLSYLPDHPSLLILDNCEHVLAGAAALAQHILQRHPNLCVLATSRQSFGVIHEHVYRLAPLDRASQLELFHAAAPQTLQPSSIHDKLVTAICAALDGVPLAIQLAASQLTTMSLEELLKGLDQRLRILRAPNTKPERHRSLHASISWSFDLLTAHERRAIAALSVFPTSFNRDAAHHVLRDSAEDADAIDTQLTITDLCDKSLLVREQTTGQARFRIPETIRQYAAEQLPASSTARQRHADYFAATLAEHDRTPTHPATPLTTGRQPNNVRQTDVEFDNIRAAFHYAVETSNTDLAARIISDLTVYSEHHPTLEVSQWIDAYLDLAAERPDRATIRAHLAAAFIHTTMSHWPNAEHHARRAYELNQQHDHGYRASALAHLAPPLAYQGHINEAFNAADEALNEITTTGRSAARAGVHYVRTYTAIYADKLTDDDLALLAELARQHHTPATRPYVNGAYAVALLATGNPHAAPVYRQAIADADAVGHAHMQCLHRSYLAIAEADEQPERLLQALRIALHSYDAAHLPFGPRQVAVDCLNAFAQLQRWETIALLHGATPPAAVRMTLAHHAKAAARQQLGPHRYDKIATDANTIDNEEFSRTMHNELDHLDIEQRPQQLTRTNT